MKIIPYLTTLHLCFLATAVLAQYREVLSAEKTVYHVYQEVLDDALPGVITIQGDTAIDQHTYKKVYFSGEFNQNATELMGFVREIADEGKMWFLGLPPNQEYLVMDLGLTVGDSFPIFFEYGCGIPAGGSPATVIETSEVENRKTVIFDRSAGGSIAGCDSLTFIEGVGPNLTVFFQNLFLGPGGLPGLVFQVCRMYQADTLSFPLFSDVDLCGFPTYVEEANQSGRVFSIGPNPTSGEVVLKKDRAMPTGPGLTLFSLYDLHGRELAAIVITDEPEQVIRFPQVPLGLYFFRISHKGQVVQAGKVVKH